MSVPVGRSFKLRCQVCRALESKGAYGVEKIRSGEIDHDWGWDQRLGLRVGIV